MTELIEQFKALEPTFAELLAISCAPGLSLGVIYHGKIIHTAHFGRQNSLDPRPPNDDTMYYVASLTKILTSSAVAQLVEEGILDWDVPIRKYLPVFSQRTDEIGQKTTLRDLLSHRAGLPNADWLLSQQYGTSLMPRSEIVRQTTFFEAVRPFREKFLYSQWNYGLVTEVIEAVTGMTVGSYIKDKILDPLSMRRTTLRKPDDENVAVGHAVCNNGTPCEIGFPDRNDGVGLAGAFACKSSVKDLLLLYQGLLRAKQDQAQTKLNRTPDLPFMHTNTIFSPHIGIGPSAEKLTYCLGLYRTQFPVPLSVISTSNLLLGPSSLLVTGKSLPGLEIYHHRGNMPGYLSSVCLVPSTQSGVVVLTNALPFMDPTHLVGQLILSVLLGEELPTNCVELAEMARTAGLSAYAELSAAVSNRKTGKPPRFPLRAYEGCYWNAAENFCLTITADGGAGLVMNVQDNPQQIYHLEPHDGDTFCWPPDREKELCEQGRWPNLQAATHEIVFGTEEDEQSIISHLMWHHDKSAKPEMFRKRTTGSEGER